MNPESILAGMLAARILMNYEDIRKQMSGDITSLYKRDTWVFSNNNIEIVYTSTSYVGISHTTTKIEKIVVGGIKVDDYEDKVCNAFKRALELKEQKAAIKAARERAENSLLAIEKMI